MKRARLVIIVVTTCIIGLCVGVSNPVSTFAVNTSLSTSAVHFVNNENSSIDFKLSEDDTNIVHKIVQNHSSVSDVDKDETDALKNRSAQRDMSHHFGTMRDQYTKSALAWLISNSIYTRPHNVVFDNGYARADLLPDGSDDNADSNVLIDQNIWLSTSAYANKADFYMMLYKSLNGIKSSNVCIYKGASYRNSSTNATITPVSSTKDYDSRATYGSVSNYWGDYLDASFIGDYYAYVSPDVYELYFKELVDAGVISTDEFSESSSAGKGFVNDYNNFSKADWNTNKETFTPKNGSRALGYSVSIATNRLTRTENPKYFKNNKIEVMDALTVIAGLVHGSEKEISKTEAKIVAYKYGITYFSDLSEEERDTIYFLIAKGILNYDDADRMIDISGYLTRGQMYELMYRVANTDARYDFSKVQLTDSDAELADMGFSETKCDIAEAKVEPIRELVSVQKASDEDTSAAVADTDAYTEIQRVFHNVVGVFSNPLSVNAAKSQRELSAYNVVMQFDLEIKDSSGNFKTTGNSYQYIDGDLKIDLNKQLASNYTNLAPTGDGSDSSEKVITDAKIVQIRFNDRVTRVLQVTFTVRAASKTNAKLFVDERIDTKINNRAVSTVTGITAIEDTASNKSCTLLEQDTITRTFSDITFLTDKVILNNKTGVRAIIDDVHGYALVGNTIIKSNNILVMTSRSNVKKYYNVEILCGLMPSVSLKKAGFNNKGNNAIYNIAVFTENSVDKITYTTSNVAQSKAYYVNFTKEGEIKSTDIDKSTTVMYNTSSLCDGVSTLIRTFETTDPSASSSSSEEEKVKVTLVVDFRFFVPPEELVTRGDKWFSLDKVNSGKTLTLQDVINFEIQRPEDGTIMADYWDSNLAYSNAIANFMYGTKKQEWITCGYIVPQIHVCVSGIKSTEKSISAELQTGGSGSEYSRLEKILENLFFNTPDVENFTYLSKYSKFLKNGNAAYWWISFTSGTGISCSNADAPALERFMRGVRIFDASYTAKTTKFGEVFRKNAANLSYFITTNGVVYRNVALDERIDAIITGKKVSEIKVRTQENGKQNNEATADRKNVPENAGKVVTWKNSSGKELKFMYSAMHSTNNRIALIPAMGVTEYYGDSLPFSELRGLAVPCILNGISPEENVYNADYTGVTMRIDTTGTSEDKIKEDLLNTYSAIQKSIFRCVGDAPKGVKLGNLLCVTMDGTNCASNTFWNPSQFKNDDVFNTIGFVGTRDVITVNKAKTTNAGYKGSVHSVFVDGGLYVGNGSGFSAASARSIGLRLAGNSPQDGSVCFNAWVAPIFFFNEAEWEFKGNSLRHVDNVSVLYDTLSVFTPSLNDCVITAELDKNLGAVTVDKLDMNTRLIIADTVWIKQSNGRWVSEPIKDKKLVNGCKSMDPNRVRKELGVHFQSLLMRYNGKSYQFLNYVKSAEDSNEPAAKVALYNGVDVTVWKRGVVTRDKNGNIRIGYCKGKNNKIKYTSVNSGKSAQYAVIDIALDSSLKARPINANRTVFALCTSVGEGIVGSAAYSLIDADGLNFELKDELDISVLNNRFSPSGLIDGIKSDFMKSYYALLAKESIQFMFYLIIMLASYLLIMSWLAFCVLTRGTGRVLVEKVAEATSRAGKGLDLFRIFTLRLYSLDNSPSGTRCVIVSFVCCIIIAVCLVLM